MAARGRGRHIGRRRIINRNAVVNRLLANNSVARNRRQITVIDQSDEEDSSGEFASSVGSYF